MDLEITLKNYRCFADKKPATFRLRDGFTSFIGINNAGKSTLLRFLFEFRPLLAMLSDANQLHTMLAGHPQGLAMPQALRDSGEVFSNANERDLEFSIGLRIPTPGDPGSHVLTLIVTVPRGKVEARAHLTVDGRPQPPLKPAEVATPATLARLRELGLDDTRAACAALAKTLYVGASRYALNIGSTAEYFDLHCGAAFISMWRELKAGSSRASNEVAYRLTGDIRRILGFRDFEVNPSADGHNLKLIVDGKSQHLGEVGSGIGQFILVLAHAARARPTFVLIDEPELSLHPALQLDFLTTLASYASAGIVYATHSYGLARSASDWVYSVTRNPGGFSEVHPYEQTPRLAEFLGAMSYSGYSQLGFQTVLLVEGPTELRAVQQFLRLYGAEHKVVLLSLGGEGQIHRASDTELQEVRRICPRVFALVDSERESAGAPMPPKRLAFRTLCEDHGVDCHILERRAMENYFTEAAVTKVKGPDARALGPYEKPQAKDQWNKHTNWKIAREMAKGDLDGTDLGDFLDAVRAASERASS